MRWEGDGHTAKIASPLIRKLLSSFDPTAPADSQCCHQVRSTTQSRFIASATTKCTPHRRREVWTVRSVRLQLLILASNKSRWMSVHNRYAAIVMAVAQHGWLRWLRYVIPPVHVSVVSLCRTVTGCVCLRSTVNQQLALPPAKATANTIKDQTKFAFNSTISQF